MSTCRYCNGVVDQGAQQHADLTRCVTRLRMLLRDVQRDAKANEGRIAIETEAEIDEVLAGVSPSN